MYCCFYVSVVLSYGNKFRRINKCESVSELLVHAGKCFQVTVISSHSNKANAEAKSEEEENRAKGKKNTRTHKYYIS